jgi:hypothetical protein
MFLNKKKSMWRMYRKLEESSGDQPGALVWSFKPGSREYKLAEMMVEYRLLDKVFPDSYCLFDRNPYNPKEQNSYCLFDRNPYNPKEQK